MIAAPANMPTGVPSEPVCPQIGLPKRLRPAQPNGANGCQLAVLTKKAPAMMTSSTTATLIATIALLKRALSRMPITRTVVRDRNDDQRRQVEPGAAGRKMALLVKQEGRIGQDVRHVQVENPDKILKVLRPAVRDGGGSDGVFEDEVPADDPGEHLAQRDIGVRVRRPGYRRHRRELRIAEGGEDAGRARPLRMRPSGPVRLYHGLLCR